MMLFSVTHSVRHHREHSASHFWLLAAPLARTEQLKLHFLSFLSVSLFFFDVCKILYVKKSTRKKYVIVVEISCECLRQN